MNRVYRDYFWVAIFLALTSACLAAGIWSARDARRTLREIREIRERQERAEKEAGLRKDENIRSMDDQEHIKGTLTRLDERSEYLDRTVKDLKEADRKRKEQREREAREKAQQKGARP